MAKDYIERDAAAIGVLGLTIVDPMVAQYADAVLRQIQQIPAADVVEVVHGRWVDAHKGLSSCKCTVCGAVYETETKYCPNCGARMDGE